MAVTWASALGWRLRRQLLDPVGTGSAVDVVQALGAIPATPESAAEAMIGARRTRSRAGDVARALADGRLIKTFAFRGATYLITPEQGGAYLALRAAGRMWERASWRDHYNLDAAAWSQLRAAVREALSDAPLTTKELAAAVTAQARFRHLGFAFADPSATFLKPLAWLGDMSFGAPRDGHATFQRLDQNPRWPGLQDLDDAGRWAVEAYFRTYGPATADHVRYWLGNGLGAGRRRIDGWLAALGDRLAEVEIEGDRCWIMNDDLPLLLAMSPSSSVLLLPGYDPWIIGPGTADPRIVPPEHRALVSRRASVVVAGGVVAGTWSLDGGEVVVTWFAQPLPLPPDEIARVSRSAAPPRSTRSPPRR